MTVASNNWQPLGAIGLTANASTTGTLEFPTFDMLMVQYSIVGYSGVADIAGLIFNYDTSPFTSNYGDRHLYVASGSTALSNVQSVSANIVRLCGFTTVQPQTGTVYMAARGSLVSQVVMTIISATGSGSAATLSAVELAGQGSWAGTSGTPADVYAIEMKTVSGTNMLAGSGFAVFGCNGL